MAILGFMLFVLGLIFVIVAPINKKKNSRCSAQVQGKLTGIRKREHGHTYIYSYSVDGTEYQVKSVNSSPEASKIGDSCTIWYDPAKPKTAQPFHYESGKVYRIILIIGIVMILLGILLLVIGVSR
ncbi:MAG: DUF3592 domain-containing protein [Lachnospiraceae bacterium]|nr:DUF3592 domain-containing protein [Lachnospiraceae bacterium]